MDPAAFDVEKAKKVEELVCEEFGYMVRDIVSFPDTLAKKVVVYLLREVYFFRARDIGRAYQITYLYVPTVVEEMEGMMVVEGFRSRIENIINKLENLQ